MHQKLHPKTAAVTLALVILAFLLIVLYALSLSQLATQVAIPSAPPLAKPATITIPATVNDEVLKSTEVGTCIDPVVAKQPAEFASPPAATDLAATNAYLKSSTKLYNQWNSWIKSYESSLKSCYDKSLKAKYAVGTSDYAKYKW